MTIWVLAADSARARVFQSERKDNDFVEVISIVNPVARMKEGEIVSDKQGSQKDSFGSGHHSGSPKHSAKVVAENTFAKDIACSLDKALQRQDFQRLYIIAPPKFLGKLRPNLSEGIKNRVQGEYNHDVSALKPEKVRDLLTIYW